MNNTAVVTLLLYMFFIFVMLVGFGVLIAWAFKPLIKAIIDWLNRH